MKNNIVKKTVAVSIMLLSVIQISDAQVYTFDGSTVGTVTTTPNATDTNSSDSPLTNQTLHNRNAVYYGGNGDGVAVLATVKDDYNLSQNDITIKSDFYSRDATAAYNEFYIFIAPATTQSTALQNIPITGPAPFNRREGMGIGFSGTGHFRIFNQRDHITNRHVEDFSTVLQRNIWNTLEITFGVINNNIVIRSANLNGSPVPSVVDTPILDGPNDPATISEYPWVNGQMRLGIGVDDGAQNFEIISGQGIPSARSVPATNMLGLLMIIFSVLCGASIFLKSKSSGTGVQ